jgi:hypothetical protein
MVHVIVHRAGLLREWLFSFRNSRQPRGLNERRLRKLTTGRRIIRLDDVLKLFLLPKEPVAAGRMMNFGSRAEQRGTTDEVFDHL